MREAGALIARPEVLHAEELVALLDSWVGKELSVRVVSADGDLIAVWQTALGQRSPAKHPARFWALVPVSDQARRAEVPGIYLHSERLQAALLHVDPTVLDIEQGGIKLSLRLL